MSDTQLADIKQQLYYKLAGIGGAKTVYTDLMNVTLTEQECPCIIVALPAITATMPINGLAEAVYHFHILYLYAPFALALPETADQDMDKYWTDVCGVLFGALTLSTKAVVQDFDGDIVRPLVDYRNVTYWGYDVPWYAKEQVTITVAA